jgi:signal transduction histidine kinase/ABC-type amino acid transport substrate-binding protein
VLAFVLVLCTLGAFGSAPQAQVPRASIRVVLDDVYPPYTFRAPDGRLQGILVDQWALWEKKTGIKVRLDGMDWDQAQQRMAAGEYDVIDTIFASEQRRALYDFGPPYARIDVPIFFSTELAGIRGPGDLAGFIVGAKRGDNSIPIQEANGVTNFKFFNNYQDIVAAARDGRLKVFTIDRPPALYYLIKMGIQDQFRATEPLYSGELHRAVRKGDTALLAAVQGGFDAISQRDYRDIERRWYGAPLITRKELTIAAKVAAGSAGVLCLLLLWVWTLRRNVRQRTRELSASQVRIQSISHNFVNGMFYQIIVDRAGNRKFTFLSDSVEELYGVPAAAAMADARLIYDRIHEDDIDALLEKESEAIRTLSTFKAETRIKGPSGQIRWSSFVSTPKRLEDGSICWDGIEFIITERKQAESEQVQLQAQLMQAQKMESLGTLAGGVAHDMNNVLGAILALASANLESQPADSPARSAFATIAQAAVRGGKMVRSLLSFARQSPAETSQLDFNALLRDEVGLLEHTTLSRVRLVLDLEPGLRPIRGDANALSHCLMNLCVNAVDAMPDNGTLILRTLNLDLDRIEVQVEDTGCGMTEEVRSRALDPFFTTKTQGKGTGLGLSLVYSAVKAHQGEMEIESEPGRGTRVKLRFPVCVPSAQASEAPAAAPAAPPRALTVLLVDDDELIRSSMEEVLGCLGHQVISALSGEEALERLEACHPDVVIMDVNMPGLGGAGTLPRLRSLRPEMPVILATGRADQAVLALIEGHSRVSLLSKPFSMAELQRHLELVGNSLGL